MVVTHKYYTNIERGVTADSVGDGKVAQSASDHCWASINSGAGSLGRTTMAKPTKAPKQATKTIKRAIGDGGGVSPSVALKRIRK